MLRSICSYTPFCSTVLDVVEGYPKTAIATALFFAYVGACVYDMRSKGVSMSIGNAEALDPNKYQIHSTTIGFQGGTPYVSKTRS